MLIHSQYCCKRDIGRRASTEGDFDGWEGLDEAAARIEGRGGEEPNGTAGVPPELLFMREKDALGPVGNRAPLESMLGDVCPTGPSPRPCSRGARAGSSPRPGA